MRARCPRCGFWLSFYDLAHKPGPPESGRPEDAELYVLCKNCELQAWANEGRLLKAPPELFDSQRDILSFIVHRYTMMHPWLGYPRKAPRQNALRI